MANTGDRADPKSNKSQATRAIIAKMPNAKFPEVSAAVKAEFGHEIARSLFYMLKAKGKMKAQRKASEAKSSPAAARSASVPAPMNTAAMWVDAIKLARRMLKATGSVQNAKSLLEAVADE